MAEPPSAMEAAILAELNTIRTNPLSAVPHLEAMLGRFRGNQYVQDRQHVRVTQEGAAVVQETIAFLRQQEPRGRLQFADGLRLAAQDHVADQSQSGATGHDGSDGSNVQARSDRYGQFLSALGENIGYGESDALGVVLGLVIDDGVPDRGHRRNTFDGNFDTCGVAYGSHPAYGSVCVIDFAGGYENKDLSAAAARPARSHYVAARDRGYVANNSTSTTSMQVGEPQIICCALL